MRGILHGFEDAPRCWRPAETGADVKNATPRQPHAPPLSRCETPAENDGLRMKSLSEYEQKLDHLRDNCPVWAALDVIRGRWKPSILWELNGGTKRFSDLQTALPDVTAQALTVQLRQLEADGVVARTIYAEVPARVEYALTDHGRGLSAVMGQLERWGRSIWSAKPGSGCPGACSHILVSLSQT